MTGWNADQIPDQHGRIAVVTGANSGLGLVTATELARRGAKVVLAVRDTVAGERAAGQIKGSVAQADLEVRELDLASLSSVRSFSKELTADFPAIDVLVNNAGLVVLGPARTTADGFELHFGTNVLGPFALTGLLLTTLGRGDAPRVVSLSSLVHKSAHLDLDDLMSSQHFDASQAYRRSKLAVTAFGLELDRRLRASGSSIASVVAHPGLSNTNLTARALQDRRRIGPVVARLAGLVTQPAEQGALPQLYAATAAGVRGGQFFGPSGRGERRGHVVEVRPSAEAADPAVGRRLWSAAETLTGVTYL
jgi:NAD(P)-dependent dehydrogenase (short-subunit alcohol dehydrogenase family)